MKRALALIVLSLASLACTPATRVEKVRWHDQDAYRLSNARAEAVIVPAWRRVMHYSLLGGPNVLWNGELPREAPKPDAWINYGGEKAWIWPQNEWTNARGEKREFPPADDIVAAPGMEVVRVGDGTLTFAMPVSLITPHRIVRTYSLDASGQLVIDSAFEAAPASPAAGNRPANIAWALWSVAQIPRPNQLTATLLPKAAIKTITAPEIVEMLSATQAAIKVATPTATKSGIDATQLIAHYGSYTLSVAIDAPSAEQGPVLPGELAQVYVTELDPGKVDGQYVELEFTSPRMAAGKPLPKQRVVFTIDRKTMAR